MALGLVLALVACLMYGAATLLQAVGTRRARGLGAFIQPLVLIGLAVDGGAFLVSLVAYGNAPLFVVQTVIAAAVVVAVVLAPRFLPGVRLRRIDLVGVVVVVVGLVLVAISAGPESDARPGRHALLVLLVLTGALVAATAASYRAAPAWVMAALGGIGFSLVAIGSRMAEQGTFLHALLSPVAVVVLGGGAVGVLGNLRALEKGSVAVAASVVAVLEVVIPSVVGTAMLGDEVRRGWVPVLVVGVAAALAGCVSLSASPTNLATEAPPPAAGADGEEPRPGSGPGPDPLRGADPR